MDVQSVIMGGEGIVDGMDSFLKSKVNAKRRGIKKYCSTLVSDIRPTTMLCSTTICSCLLIYLY